MKSHFHTSIVVIVCSLIFQACAAQLEVNPGFGKKGVSETATPKAPVTKLPEGPEAQKPVWKIGYKWEFEWKRPGRSGTRTRRIIREETFDGIPSFVIKSGRWEYFWTKDVLGLLASKRGWKVITKRTAPFQPFAWPLRVGRQWNNVYTRERPQEESSFNIDMRVVVEKLEEVTVPAGKFKAFAIKFYNSYSGELVNESWYSPKVKWFVKWIRYYGRGDMPLEYRLKSYTID